MRRIGIQMHAIPGLEPEAYVKKIGELGFDATFTGVPPMDRIPWLKEMFGRYGILWESMHAPFDGINNIWLEGEAGDTMLQRLLNGVDACAAAEVPPTSGLDSEKMAAMMPSTISHTQRELAFSMGVPCFMFSQTE